MDNKGYISKKKKGSSLYEELHEEALEILQKFSGSVWTDYNEHDPGVTLLENISYAITELAHKTSLPIQDLLQSSKGTVLQSGDNGLFVASDILTTNPVTFNDYRKIWIDQIPNVKNVWVYPIDDYEKELNNIKGLLHVFVEKYEYHVDPTQEATENKQIIDEVQDLYNSHRNLCESLYAVEVYKPLTLSVDLRITLLDLVDGEEILANILHRINDYLAPEVSYYSLRKLQEENIPTHTIFNGPHLVNGFIKDEDLKNPLDVIEVSEIIKIISKIPGVVNINDFCLNYVDPTTKEQHIIKERLQVPKNTTARVRFPLSNEKLIFENSGVSFQPDLKETKKQLAFIQALDASKFKAASNSLNNIAIPQGTMQDIGYHYPIRKQFPEIYGIGDRGIGHGATPLRQAQVKQLQAYLLPFDQLIINFLSQLCNIYTLYDVHNNEDASYFTNILPDTNDLLDLIAPPSSTYTPDQVKAYWEKKTNDLNAFFDNHSLERLNKVSDQLLSRYSEAFQTYTLLKINKSSYGDAMSSKRFEKQLLAAKQELIKEYASISYNRSKSFNYKNISIHPEEDKKQAIPGIFRKIAILMGVNDFKIKSLIKNISESGIRIHPQTLDIDFIVREIDIHTPEENIGIVEIEDIVVNEEIEENLFHTMHYVGDEDTLLNSVLKYGIIPDNYTIKKDPNKKERYYISHQRNDNKSNIVHIAKSREKATKVIEKSINYLIDVSQKSEGFFVVEHVLLLPSYFGDYFGFEIDFSLLNPELEIVCSHADLTPFVKRDETITNLIEALLAKEAQFNIVSANGVYQLEIGATNGDVFAISKTSFESKEALQKIIEGFKNEVNHTEKEDIEAITKCHVFYGDHAIDEHFFSFRLSFVMPKWPVRFQNENFQKVFENTIYEQIPIHIGSSSYWLDYKTMYLFETYYFKWLELLQHPDADEDKMYQAYQLIKLLQKLDNNEA
ncbi:hypothetical protein A8C32_05140 [Flavivirga aquatica]|uniref:Uncharacterized protein n=1 Tax=Flavivirga aquatica TaxID=1849968 RepID=A0A1E5SHH9_9FLAO|nr:hypothetical protein [Flavivirga aquatica]OEJ98587.1 hypothetical protein A8C32_05140 [Flavivirga aquatica]